MNTSSLSRLCVVGVLTFGLAACKPVTSPQATPPPTPVPDTSSVESEKLAAAIKNGEPTTCNITKKDGTSTMKYFVKGKMMKMLGTEYGTSSASGNMISDAQNIYIWQDGQKTGIKMQVPDAEDITALQDKLKAQGATIPDLTNPDTLKEYEQKNYTVACAPATFTDAEFVPPTTVKFTDTSALINGALNMLKGSTGSALPKNAADAQKMLEQLRKQQ